jgi:uncharacterized protein with PQ loop repeat
MDFLQTITFASTVGFLTLIVGVLVKVIGLPDQIRKNYNRKSTEGLSTTFMILALLSYSLWTLHGILRNDIVLIIGQGLGIFTTSIIICQIYKYRKKK